ncbi:MAG: class I SAM-dependent methyltransferase [Gammaproteobacteria bacterium]
MKLSSLPFHIGPCNTSLNPGGLPNVYPFELIFDEKLGILKQPVYTELESLLQKAYKVGQTFGTPLAEDAYGKPYTDDFLSYIEKANIPVSNGLEIGAGVGYLTRRLMDKGWTMTSLEPGKGYEPFWSRYGITIIREFFPTPRVTGSYDLICSYGVLEHVSDPINFLTSIRDCLSHNGKAVISVPDCTEEILAGDPSIMFHEHINYFDAGSLKRLFKIAGMNAIVKKSNHGRCLYVLASVGELEVDEDEEEFRLSQSLSQSLVASYPARSYSFITRFRSKLSVLTENKSIGIYCAARGLILLDTKYLLRFFDDDPMQQGKYYPPFNVPIESREKLIASPVENLIIMSRTFGKKIRESIINDGYQGKVITLDEL